MNKRNLKARSSRKTHTTEAMIKKAWLISFLILVSMPERNLVIAEETTEDTSFCKKSLKLSNCVACHSTNGCTQCAKGYTAQVINPFNVPTKTTCNSEIVYVLFWICLIIVGFGPCICLAGFKAFKDLGGDSCCQNGGRCEQMVFPLNEVCCMAFCNMILCRRSKSGYKTAENQPGAGGSRGSGMTDTEEMKLKGGISNPNTNSDRI